MCGINGFVSEKYSLEEREIFVRKMNTALAHRGPDNDGIYSHGNITLGHRRLSIIDLSSQGNQPFYSADNRYVIVYNGELYNYKELKLELQRTAHGANDKPYFFKTNTDTEVVLAAFLRWGFQCLDFFNGMYAFAIYDCETKKLIAARDRVGVKPFYYSYGDEGFVFSSEVRAIIKSEIKKFSLNKTVVAEYAMYQTVHAPNTIVKGIKVLMPGHFLEFDNNKATVTQYYTLNKITKSGQELSYEETCSRVNELLATSVQRRMLADVPFGAFLSGGIDSSIIVGLMSKVSSAKIQTFNVSFDESEFSESKYAKQIAAKFNTNHHEIKLRPEDFLKDLPEGLSAMDHPGGDGLNTYIVSKATKNAGITMALSGIGGDELFAGYEVFKRMFELQKKSWLNAVPLFFRKSMGAVIAQTQSGVSGKKIQELLSQTEINFNSAYPLIRSLFTEKELQKLTREKNGSETIHNMLSTIPQLKDHLISATSIAEMNSYLQNVLLRDADQMGMAVALEIREPFLDFKLIDFVLGIPDEFKYPHSPKKLLVDSVGDLLPQEIVNRPKMGFTLPWQHWLKNELKPFCEKNIVQFAERNILDREEVLNLWKRFLGNDKNVNWSRVWHLVILNNWINEYKIKT